MKKSYIKRNEAIFPKIKEIIDYAAIIGFFYILLYQIEVLRNLCKAICKYVVDNFVSIELSVIKNFYFSFEGVAHIMLALSAICWGLSGLIRFINERRMKKKSGDGRFEESLFRYLHDMTVSRCFLVTGQWGSGKTYEINNFFDKYYRYTKTRVYRVSCFGLNSRKELVSEINNIIEQSDKSFYAQIIKVLQYLPVIGEAINKFLKKEYKYDSIEKGSIFIFDDFERLTSRVITNEYTGKLYQQSNSFRHTLFRGIGKSEEFKEIEKEFEEVNKAFSKIENFVNKNSDKGDYDKYIAVIGFINELIEIYKMKVIVVCNSNILGEKFVHEVLRSKLNCLEYKKIIVPEMKISIIDNIFESRVFSDKEKQKCIKNYFDLLKRNINDIKLDEKFNDMRLFSGLLQAFVDTALLFDISTLTNDFLNSLLNSIMIMHLGYYKNSIERLGEYVNGANIMFLSKLFGGPIDTENLVRVSYSKEEIKWIDADVSGYWIFSLSAPNELNLVREEWEKYE